MAVVAAVGPSAYWYLTRATGTVALLLLTASVVLGVLGAVRFTAPRWPRFAVDTVHRDISLLVVVFLVLHIVTSVLDGFAPISLIDAVIPLHSAYRPLWLGLGAVSFDLIIALVATSLVRRRLGYRSWRAVHWLAYASWPVAVLHTLGTGTDAKAWWLLLLSVGCLTAVVVAVLVRIARAAPVSDRTRSATAVLALATPLAIAIFALVGPLQRGWASKAGTPRSLLGAKPRFVSVRRPATRTSAADPLKQAFTATLEGTASQRRGPNGTVIQLLMTVAGPVSGVLRVRMGGLPLQNGGLSLSGSQVDLSAAGVPEPLTGRLTELDGNRLVARVSNSAGLAVSLQASVNIDSSTDRVTGTLAGQPI